MIASGKLFFQNSIEKSFRQQITSMQMITG